MRLLQPDRSAQPSRIGAGRSRAPLHIAHRGASVEAPENTLSALRRAVDLRTDMVEVDVQRTRDGVLVLMHDATLTRTTDVRERFPDRRPWRVPDLTLAELRQLDAGSWHSAAYAGERVPTLDEAIELLDAHDVGLLLELKRPELHRGVVLDLAVELVGRPTYVRRAVPAGKLVVQSFDFTAMKELKTRLPQLRVGLIGQPPAGHLPTLATWASQVTPRHALVDGEYVAAVHDAGLECLVWTVDRPRAMRRALRTGVDGIITNRPATLAALALAGWATSPGVVPVSG